MGPPARDNSHVRIALMSKRVISPGGVIDGVVELPGDKSISHRYAILGALAEGRREIGNYASAADCQSTLECLRRLGVEIEANDGTWHRGRGLNGLGRRASRSMRKIPGPRCACWRGFWRGRRFVTLTGDDSLRRRPMRRVIEPLRQMGAEIRSKDGDRAPLEIRGGPLRAIDYAPPTPSAQVKSAVLLGGALRRRANDGA